jgi:thiosulfate/3-mercaptopyruvate sulfurtransferase
MPEYTTFLPKPDLYQALVEAVGFETATAITRGQIPVTTSCGSGMSAGVLWLGLKLLEAENVSLYDEVGAD